MPLRRSARVISGACVAFIAITAASALLLVVYGIRFPRKLAAPPRVVIGAVWRCHGPVVSYAPLPARGTYPEAGWKLRCWTGRAWYRVEPDAWAVHPDGIDNVPVGQRPRGWYRTDSERVPRPQSGLMSVPHTTPRPQRPRS